MKSIFLAVFILLSIKASTQSVFGYWYGFANVQSKVPTSNYLVEIILQPETNYVKGVLNYYFKNTYRSLQVKGNFNKANRELRLYNVPITYFGSNSNMPIDCIMNLQAVLKTAKAGSTLKGSFVGLPDNRYTCIDISFNLSLDSDVSKKDSVLKAIREYKETNQVWVPSESDTLMSARIGQRKVINYVVENQYKERKNEVTNEIEVESDSLNVDFYDNGEVDGDSISVFFNKQLLAFSQKLSARSVHFDLTLDQTKEVNELSMFADNLGSIAPNTALMIINDGVKTHEVRLSSNFEKNATVVIRRKKKP